MTHTTYPKEISALILIDVLNEFLSKDGKINPQIQHAIEKIQLIPSLIKLVEGVRAAGLKIIYSPHGLHEHSFDDMKYIPERMQMAMKNQVFWEGSFGADFFEPLRPQEGDIILTRHRMFDSFIGTDLDIQLKHNGIEKVILAGLTSSTCVEGTGRHAIEVGYHLTFLTDAVADFTDESHQAATNLSYPIFGHEVLTVNEFLNILK